MLWNVISTACTSIETYFSDKISEAGGNVALGLWNGIIDGLGDIAKWIYDNIISPIIEGFKNGMGIHSPSTVMADLGENVVEGLIKGIEDKITNLGNTVTTVCNNVKTWFSEKMSKSKFIQTGKGVIDGVKSGIQNNSAYTTITNVCSNVKTWFSDKLQSSKFNSIGSNIISGIKTGINSMKNSLKTTVTNIAGKVSDWFKSKLDINSPSRVLRDEVGRFIPLGIAEGIKSQAQSVYDSVYEITDGLKLDKQGLVTDMSVTYSKANINSDLLSGRSIMEKALNNSSTGSNNTINLENVIKLNSKTLARELLSDLNDESKRLGYKPILQKG